jgi:AcrR family transcriptional regulator
MQRTRAALLDGAVRAVEKHGARRTTMADVAMLAGVAKGTLYNHFRTKEAVYSATADAAIRSLGDECRVVAVDDLGEALALAADRIASHPALRRIAAEEPVVLAGLVAIGDGGVWASARSVIAEVLTAAGADAVRADLVLRWLVSFVATPGPDVEAQAMTIAAALTPAVPVPAGSSGTNS